MRLATLFLIISFSVAGHAQDIEQALQDCRKISDPTGRLLCYDRIGVANSQSENQSATASRPNQPAAEPVTPKTTTPAPAQQPVASAAKPVEEFGLRKPRKSKKETPKSSKELDVTIVRYLKNSSGKYILQMENGQIWEQTQTSSFHISDSELPMGARIKKNFLGGYRLMLKARNQSIAVKRNS